MGTPKLLHATKWIHLFERDGWIYASRRLPGQPGRIDAVSIVALHRDANDPQRHRLVVIEEHRAPIDGWEFGLPAGLLDPGEEIAACAARELREETGLEVSNLIRVSGKTYTSAGLADETQAFALLTCTGVPAESPGVDNERIRVHLLSRQGCADLLARNDRGEVALSSRLWPLLMSAASEGRACGLHLQD